MMLSVSQLSQRGNGVSTQFTRHLHRATKASHRQQLAPILEGTSWRNSYRPGVAASAFDEEAVTGEQGQATASSRTAAAAAASSSAAITFADAAFYCQYAVFTISPIGPQHIPAGKGAIRVKSGTGSYVVTIALRYTPDGQSRCDWDNAVKFAFSCEEAVTAVLYVNQDEPLVFEHDTLHGRGLAGELMTKLTWSLVSETGGVLVSIEQISKASGQEVIKEATCELTAAQAKIVQQLVYGTLPVMYGFDLALKG